MNIRQISIIGGALLVAGGAFVWLRSQSANPQVTAPAPSGEAKVELVNVLVAKRDMELGERISEASLGWAPYTPASASTPGFVLQSKNPDAIKDFTNGIVRQAMVAGEPILLSKIVNVGDKTGAMAALLTPGMRAITFPVTTESGVAGFVLPNDKVDIVLTREVQFMAKGQTQSRVVSSTIMENVRVLAIDQAIQPNKDAKTITGTSATVELSAADAEKLRIAQKLGDLSLMLRGYADMSGPTYVRAGAPVLVQGVVSTPANPAPAAPSEGNNGAGPPPAPTPVKVYRGGQ